MRRGSQSSRKQPAFDPRELEDLIFSPAVGSGVGSHLVGNDQTNHFPSLPHDTSSSHAEAGILSSRLESLDESEKKLSKSEEDPFAQPKKIGADQQLADASVDISSVVTSFTTTVATHTTVDMSDLQTVDRSMIQHAVHGHQIEKEAHRSADVGDMSTVSTSDMSTVDINDAATVAGTDMTAVEYVCMPIVDGPDCSNNDATDSSAVATSKLTTVDRTTLVEELPTGCHEPIQVNGDSRFAVSQPVNDSHLPTVVMFPCTTVDVADQTTVDRSGHDTPNVGEQRPENYGGHDGSNAVAVSKETTVDTFDANTGRSTVAPEATVYPRELHLWVTEDGDVVAQSRVKRIRIAQDVINSAEESVYDTLWNTRSQSNEQGSGDSSRIVQAGYHYLMKRTRLSKKTIQRIVDRLIHKDFIAIERPADIYRRVPTVYRVFDYRTILARHGSKGRTHIAKIGPGFTYAFPIGDPRIQYRASRSSSSPASDLTTVVAIDRSTVVNNGLPTEAERNTVTVVKQNETTVVDQTTIHIDKRNLGEHSSASVSGPSRIEDAATATASVPHELILSLHRLVNFADSDAVALLWSECRLRVADCTIDEVLHFTEMKAAVFKTGKIQNPTGFLLATVPKCFEGQAFQAFREQETKRRAERQRREEEKLRRARIEQEDLRAEEKAYRKAEEALASLSTEQYQALYNQTRSEYLVLVPKAASWTQGALDQSIRARMIRELQSTFPEEEESTP